MNQKTITEFLSNEYKEFALYSIEGRVIPSVIDGFKPTQRKIIHIANQIWRSGTEKNLKVFQLSGKVASDAFYHHGDMSLSNAIINLAQKFKNNAPLLEEDGQFGSLRSPQLGAPRYIGTRLSSNFKQIYKDFELLEYKQEEGESIEPKFFLPIIPTVLINGGSGIAVGFASNILNRDVREIIDACINYLNGKQIPTLKPSLNNFNGVFTKDELLHRKWSIRGKFDRQNTNTVKITELPPSMTYEKYEEILDRLLDNKEIVSYEDNCKDNIDYTIKFTRQQLESLSDDSVYKLLKLEESETEHFNTLDEYGKLMIFESAEEILKYFIDFRLTYYHKRKQHQLNALTHDLKVLGNRGRFIKFILEEKMKVNNIPKNEIILQLESLNFDKIEENFDYLLKMPIYSLTKENFEKLKSDFQTKREEIESLKSKDPKELYLNDLRDLRKINK